jgi:hypothetical protein
MCQNGRKLSFRVQIVYCETNVINVITKPQGWNTYSTRLGGKDPPLKIMCLILQKNLLRGTGRE